MSLRKNAQRQPHHPDRFRRARRRRRGGVVLPVPRHGQHRRQRHRLRLDPTTARPSRSSAPTGELPPYTVGGVEAVRAYVYRDAQTNDLFVGYLLTYPPDRRNGTPDQPTLGPTESNPPALVKRPGGRRVGRHRRPGQRTEGPGDPTRRHKPRRQQGHHCCSDQGRTRSRLIWLGQFSLNCQPARDSTSRGQSRCSWPGDSGDPAAGPTLILRLMPDALHTFDSDLPLALELGGSLKNVRVAYETWGTLNAERSNAVLICHALSGDSHVARHHDADAPGWWDIAVGAGQGDRHATLFSSSAPTPSAAVAGRRGRAASTPTPGGGGGQASPTSRWPTRSRCSAG